MVSVEKKAITSIRNYLNKTHDSKWTDEYIQSNYSEAIEMLIEQAESIEELKKQGIGSKREGDQSITYNNSVDPWCITSNIQAFLPLPYIRMW